jgi:hypothetical protein
MRFFICNRSGWIALVGPSTTLSFMVLFNHPWIYMGMHGSHHSA